MFEGGMEQQQVYVESGEQQISSLWLRDGNRC